MVMITEMMTGPALDGAVTITTAAPTAPADFVQPSSAELRKLEALVYRLRPRLDLRNDRDFQTMDHVRAFAHAFIALSWMGRRDDVDHGRAITSWVDYANNLLREGRIDETVPHHVFLAAMLASGDVPYSRNALGLARVQTGSPATNAWRAVLKSGAVRPASPEQATRDYQHGQVRVTEMALPVGMMPTGTR